MRVMTWDHVSNGILVMRNNYDAEFTDIMNALGNLALAYSSAGFSLIIVVFAHFMSTTTIC